MSCLEEGEARREEREERRGEARTMTKRGKEKEPESLA